MREILKGVAAKSGLSAEILLRKGRLGSVVNARDRFVRDAVLQHAHQLARTRGNNGRVAASIARDELDGSPEDATPLVQLFCREKRAVE